MKRGVIRIISGVVLILLQVLSLLGQDSASISESSNPWFYIGFFSPTIIGISLLVPGYRAYRNAICSELVLHSNSRKIHTVIKWIGFTLSGLLSVNYLIFLWYYFDISILLSLISTLTFAIYSLFYLYKKPSCLFSTTLIFIGVSYLYGILSNLAYYAQYFMLNLPMTEQLVLHIISMLIAGMLYIVSASILYKEDFAVNVIKTLGWTIFALEIFDRVVISIVLLQHINFIDLLDLAFVVVVNLYMCVFKVNTLRYAPAPSAENTLYFEQSVKPSFDTMPVPATGWRCSCGRPHPRYETSCICGKSKFNEVVNLEHDETVINTDIICFCRRCGNKLSVDAAFCGKCGTEIIRG